MLSFWINQMGAITTATAQPETETNLIQRIGYFAALGLTFALCSRLLDVTGPGLHLPQLLGGAALLCALVSGGLRVCLQTRVWVLYALLTCWFAAGVPFSIWHGGSFGVFQSVWLRTLVVWVFVVGLVVTFDECRVILNTLAFASATAALTGIIMGGQTAEGRLVVDGGTLRNPNDFALVLLLGLPFLWHLYDGGGRPGIVRRVAAIGGGCLTVAGLLRTGSRGGLYAALFLILLIVLRAPVITKLLVIAASLALLAIMATMLPANLRHRYLTISSTDFIAKSEEPQSQVEATAVGSAMSSAENRMLLLKQSIAITLQHPIFGVGLGNFPVYVNKMNKEEGRPKDVWHGTHNTYTQLSSETGIPGLALFIGILVVSWRSLGRVIRATRRDSRPRAREIRASALAVQMALAAVAFFILFAHIGYKVMPHLMVAVAVCVSRTAGAELRRLGPMPQAAGLIYRTQIPGLCRGPRAVR